MSERRRKKWRSWLRERRDDIGNNNDGDDMMILMITSMTMIK